MENAEPMRVTPAACSWAAPSTFDEEDSEDSVFGSSLLQRSQKRCLVEHTHSPRVPRTRSDLSPPEKRSRLGYAGVSTGSGAHRHLSPSAADRTAGSDCEGLSPSSLRAAVHASTAAATRGNSIAADDSDDEQQGLGDDAQQSQPRTPCCADCYGCRGGCAAKFAYLSPPQRDVLWTAFEDWERKVS
jgi:hypothetical protein